ncbi:MAG: zinc-ribbon domain-containing protein [Solobacterium sp.]|nr:zinc-ribbon domain-containing protein [Solobacterium sp.]
MFCVQCGKQLDNGFRFCPYCGAQLPALTTPVNDNGFVMKNLFEDDEPEGKPAPVKPASEPVSWVTQAKQMSDSGDIQSCLVLGDAYCNLEIPDVSKQESYRLAAEYYIKALQNGSTNGDLYTGIGDVYLFKLGNRYKAVSWYKKGIEKGVKDCYSRIFTANTMPVAGDDGSVQNFDPITTWQYATEYYELDPVDASVQVAMCLIMGWGTPRDLQAAETYLTYAEQAGHDPKETALVRRTLEAVKAEDKDAMKLNVSAKSVVNGVKNIVGDSADTVKDVIKLHTGFLFKKW